MVKVRDVTELVIVVGYILGYSGGGSLFFVCSHFTVTYVQEARRQVEGDDGAHRKTWQAVGCLDTRRVNGLCCLHWPKEEQSVLSARR